MIAILPPLIAEAEEAKIAVAFVSRQGLSLIKPALDAAVLTGARVEFLVGLDMQGTEPDALREMLVLSRSNAAFSLYCYASLSPSTIYHPKMYLLNKGGDATAIIGSSNLTRGGLKGNIEANVALMGSLNEESISDAYGVYGRLKFLPGRVAPDEELLSLYADLCKTSKRQGRNAIDRQPTNDLAKRFQEKAKSLRPPVATESDLVGWLKLVYEVLPDGEFTNKDVYIRKAHFLEHYPQNRNVEAKARQQLQILRDMGLIEHIGQARWKKRRK
jgi:HKD family nuclease